ncbi:hypothetical protein [uncultured Pontibacter sp.]|uniref:hypothetical protein n=1 Tax=uncultured Pontibacter sp. TaxID=453356 RepID=UPI00261F4D7C|nr:hypothetical protein [uncultured Pontibacter sp.]
MKKQTTISLLFIIFILSLIFNLIKSLINGYEKESWLITEFLINYQGGFVRRGLLGEALYQFSQYSTISPYYIIIALCLASYVYLIYWYSSSLINNGFPFFILPFVFFLGSPIINNYWVRKDAIVLLFFILILHCLRKESFIYIILTNLLFVTGILIHESIGFFGFPVIALIIYTRYSHSNFLNKQFTFRRLYTTIVLLLPSLIAFASVIYFKGSRTIAGNIWDSWENIKFPIQAATHGAPPAAIDGISWSLQKGLRYFYSNLMNMNYDIYAPFAWFFILLSVYFIIININRLDFKILTYKPTQAINRENLSTILVIQLVAVIPLFILASDYGRWVTMWTCSTFAILLTIPEKTLSTLPPLFVRSFSHHLNNILDEYVGNSKSFIVLMSFVIGVPYYNWSMEKYIETPASVHIIQFISTIFRQIVIMFKLVIGLN